MDEVGTQSSVQAYKEAERPGVRQRIRSGSRHWQVYEFKALVANGPRLARVACHDDDFRTGVSGGDGQRKTV